MDYDTIIVGGGPAGLSAALVLGRCRRRVLVIDAGRPRNRASRHVNGFLTRDGVTPEELLGHGRAELERYGVEFRKGFVEHAACVKGGYEIRLGDDRPTTRTLLLATGIVDELPDVPNVKRFYGSGVHHCPYCDGWEYSDQPLASFGRDRKALGLALNLLTWSPTVTMVTNGQTSSRSVRREAEEHGIALREEPIRGLEGEPDEDNRQVLRRITFETGPDLEVSAMFFNTEQYQRSDLPSLLGCRTNAKGGIKHDHRQRTGVPRLYLAGDASKDVQFVAAAVAEGVQAAIAINSDLQEQDREGRPRRGR